MICIVGTDAVEVAEMAVCIAKLYLIQKDKVGTYKNLSKNCNVHIILHTLEWKE